MTRYVYICLTLFVLYLPSRAFGADEIFKVPLSGTERCGDFIQRPVTYEPLLVHSPDDFSADVYTLAGEYLFTMFGDGFAVKRRRNASGRLIGFTGSFYAIAFGGEYNYFHVQGTSTINLSGDATSISGTFFGASGDIDGCFTSGTFKSVQKLQ